jgi:D-aminopeptidase
VNANPYAHAKSGPNLVKVLSNERFSPLFSASVEASEAAIVHSTMGPKTVIGVDGHRMNAMPREPLQQVLPKYYRGRITAGPYRSW